MIGTLVLDMNCEPLQTETPITQDEVGSFNPNTEANSYNFMVDLHFT